jgi:hypothetical protein
MPSYHQLPGDRSKVASTAAASFHHPIIMAAIAKSASIQSSDFSPGTGIEAKAMVPAQRLSHALLAKFLDMQTADHIMTK